MVVRSVSVPPPGMASAALNTRFVRASRISLSIPAIIPGLANSCNRTLNHGAGLLRHIAPARTGQIDHLFRNLIQIHRDPGIRAGSLAR